MDIKAFFDKYDFRDSNLNKIISKENDLLMEIDLCNWRQPEYNKLEADMISKTIIFKNVKRKRINNIKKSFDDAIIELHLFKLAGNDYKIRIITENIDHKMIEFISNDVDML